MHLAVTIARNRDTVRLSHQNLFADTQDRLLDPQGRIAAGEMRLNGERIDNLRPHAMRNVRGRNICAIFQDPLTSVHPLLTIGAQRAGRIVETGPVESVTPPAIRTRVA